MYLNSPPLIFSFNFPDFSYLNFQLYLTFTNFTTFNHVIFVQCKFRRTRILTPGMESITFKSNQLNNKLDFKSYG